MDFRQLVDQALRRIRETQWDAQKVAVFSLLVIAALAVLVLRRPVERVEYDELFGGRVLSVSELEPIEAALGTAELTDYRLEEGRLLIPASHRAKYYAALQQANCLPRAFHASMHEALSVGNFFESARKSSERNAHAITQDARSVLCAVPGVVDAFVHFDESRRSAFDEGPRIVASVGVRTESNQPLDLQSFRMIQRIVLGFKVGLLAENVTITDLNARRSIRGEIGSVDSPEIRAIVRDTLERQWRRKVEETLSFVPEARIDVRVVPDETGAFARAASVAVGIPMTYISRHLEQNPDQDQLEFIASTRTDVQALILPLLPKDPNTTQTPQELVAVSVFETPPDREMAADAIWTKLGQSSVMTTGLVVALFASMALLMISSNRERNNLPAASLKVFGSSESTGDATNEEPASEDVAVRLRAFVEDDPDAAAKSLSEFIDRAS